MSVPRLNNLEWEEAFSLLEQASPDVYIFGTCTPFLPGVRTQILLTFRWLLLAHPGTVNGCWLFGG